MTDPRRCTATNRAGEQCGRPPMRGGKVCASHGGKIPAVLAKSRQRLEQQQTEARAVKAVERLTSERAPMSIADVYRELLDLSGLAVAWKDVLRERVDELTDYSTTSLMGGEQIRSDVLLFERAMDRALKVLEAVARLDLDTRLNSITEQQVRDLTGVVRQAMFTAELTSEQTTRFDAAMADGFRRLIAEEGTR